MGVIVLTIDKVLDLRVIGHYRPWAEALVMADDVHLVITGLTGRRTEDTRCLLKHKHIQQKIINIQQEKL